MKNIFKKMLRWLNKRGISATVIGIIILVIGLALVVVFVIFTGKQSGDKTTELVSTLNILRHGGG